MEQKLFDMITELEKEIIIFDNKNLKKFNELHASYKNRKERLYTFLIEKGMPTEWKIAYIEDGWNLHLYLNAEGCSRIILNRKGIKSVNLDDERIQECADAKQREQIYRLFSDGISFFNSIDFGMLDKKVRELDFCTENTIITQRGIAYELYSRLEWFKKCIAEE